MEDQNSILSSLEVSTSELNTKTLQKILLKVKKINAQSNHSTDTLEVYSKMLQKLWNHLLHGLNEFDDQLLCSTCFYTILCLHKDNAFMDSMLQSVLEQLNRSEGKNEDKGIKLSITYGMFQSNFLTQKDHEYGFILNDILNSILNLLINMAYEYSHHRTIVFKVLISLKKLLGTNLQSIVFTKHNQIRLLNLVNHNWENSINGTRNLNKLILQSVIEVIDDEMKKEIIEEIHAFYWNKAKYLTFSEIIDQFKGNLKSFIGRYNLVEGLLHSLCRPGLVSAGADMYYSILKKMYSDDQWADVFLDKITEMLCSTLHKAKEHFINYWCLSTLKKFPSVGMMIINSLQKHEDTGQRMFSILSVAKQCNKLNLFEKNWIVLTEVERNILCGIEHCNPQIRMTAFDIVCVSHGKSWPRRNEYEIILNFLSDNVNSDCTVLRLSMLNSLGSFLSRLQTLHLNNPHKADEDKENLLSFCAKVQEFIIFSLNLNGNYQRKVTTIKITNILFNCITEFPKKKQNQFKQINYLLIDFISDNKFWILYNEDVIKKLISLLNDPADDIRENVVQLMLSHYIKQLKQPVVINQIIDNALFKIKSKFFYDINCAQSIFRLLANVFLKEVSVNAAMFQNVEDIFMFAYNELLSEYNLKRDIVESIENGKQLHSYMCILCALFEACIKNSYKLKITEDSINLLLDILQGVSNQFVWEEGVSTSSDFSKMNDMVREIIKNSGYSSNDADDTKITGLEQIVLNCLWLNVKASCELAALIIKYCNSDTQLDVCEKSLSVITKVLETSRHKGAIEAAGVALGESIHCLTSLTSENSLSNLPLLLLKQKLEELILEANSMASVTRRGAGLSIMVHRIVSNDMRKNKPLFHYFINTSLVTCKTFDDNVKDSPNCDNEKDLPKAVYIHFLTRIVTDSSLITEVMYYSAELAELAFNNLTSPHWQIRNAALQLYGGLIPKLIGQKKPSGSEDEVTATVACDEFRTHFPNLWLFILEQLKLNNTEDILQSHSNLLPILNILEDFDVDMRMISAITNNEIASKLSKYSDEIKIISIKTAIVLLQDEDEDVRNLSVHYYKNIKNTAQVLHPYVCLRNILNFNFLSSILIDPTTGIDSICQGLIDILSHGNIVNSEDYNPFANDSKNIYQEVELIKHLIQSLKEG
ncbi:Thyroid adenoma-associated protein-like [Papilio xuthus]|uniref:Thyroid adenoma-associated protein-like n=1 Tax=Papilio xuthus TaxID=66420 RepID=A0A194PGZ3_PAPXU|nr:Thyroid adenoma-associated protein-like [Papilio xuthus]